jgi:hypothetical protein
MGWAIAALVPRALMASARIAIRCIDVLSTQLNFAAETRADTRPLSRVHYMVKNLLIGKNAAAPAPSAAARGALPPISVYFEFKPAHHG